MPISSRSIIKFSPALDRRRLAALMFTDIVGYSAIFHRDEDLAMKLLGQKCDILREIFPAYGGREIKTLGDGFFIEFPSVIEAVKCAYDIQSQLYQRNLGGMAEEKFQIRIGVHLCDFIATAEDAFGNDVNISSRLEKIAPPGGICISQQVVDQVSDKLDLKFKLLKTRELKNIKRPVVSYSVTLPWLEEKKSVTFREQVAKWVPRDLTLEKVTLLFSLGGVALAGCLIWSLFLLPKDILSDPQILANLFESLENIVTVNPFLAAILLVMWLLHPKERLFLYLAMIFSIGTLSVVEMTPGAFPTLDNDQLKLISLFSCALACFPFAAVGAMTAQNTRVETAINFCMVFLLGCGLYSLKVGDFKPVQSMSVVFSALAVAYLANRVIRQLRSKSPFPVEDMRRLLFTGVAGFAVLAQVSENTLWSNSGLFKFADLFLPVGYPLYFLIFLVIGYVAEKLVNGKTTKIKKVVQKISSVVISADSYEDKLSNLQDHICVYLNAERSTIYLTDLNGSANRLKAQAIYGPTDKLQEVALEIDSEQGLIGRVWRTRSPLLIDDFKKENRLTRAERSHIKGNEYRTRSCLIVPLVMGNEIIGVMTFSDKRENVPFTEEDLRVVQLVAKDVALLSLNARFQNMVDHFVSEKINDLNQVG